MSSLLRQLGSLFHTRGPATQKLMSKKVFYMRGMMHRLSDTERRWRRPLSEMSWISAARYWGAWSDSDWYARQATLKSTCCQIGSQCNSCYIGVMCSHRRVPVMGHVGKVMFLKNSPKGSFESCLRQLHYLICSISWLNCVCSKSNEEFQQHNLELQGKLQKKVNAEICSVFTFNGNYLMTITYSAFNSIFKMCVFSLSFVLWFFHFSWS